MKRAILILCLLCCASPAFSTVFPADSIPENRTESQPRAEDRTSTRTEREFRDFEQEFRSFSLDMLNLNDRVIESIFSHPKTLPAYSSFPGDAEQRSGFRYNRVDGLFLGLGSQERYAVDDDLYTHLGAGYAFGSRQFQAFGGLDYQLFGGKDGGIFIGLEGHRISDTHDAWKIGAVENTVHALLAREDYRIYFFRTGWSARLEQQLNAANIRLGAEFRQDLYEPMQKNVNWSVFGGEKTFRDNPQFERGWVNSLVVSLNMDNTQQKNVRHVSSDEFLFSPSDGDGWEYSNRRVGVRASLQAEIGRRDYGFERYLVEAALYQPISKSFTFNTRVRAGSVVGLAPAPKYFALGGVGSLAGFSWNELSGNRMILWNSELIFSNFLASRLFGLSVILFADVAVVQNASVEAAFTEQLLPSTINDVKFSWGIAFGSRNGAFRIGAAWRTDRAEGANIVIRLSPMW